MKPLILEFAEEPYIPKINFAELEYSEQLNLTISTRNGLPAISQCALETSTLNESWGPPDTDANSSSIVSLKLKHISTIRELLDTELFTKNKGEISESD